MLLLSPDTDAAKLPLDGFPDHLERHVAYYSPPAVELAEDDGVPAFFLLRYHGDLSSTSGGLLHLALTFTHPDETALAAATEAGWHTRPVPFDDGRCRLRLRSLQDGETEETGDWRPVNLLGKALTVAGVHLTAHETQLLSALLESGGRVVEAELEFTYRGLVPGISCMVTAVTATLLQHMTARLGPDSIQFDQVVAAFLSSGEADSVTWYGLDPAVALPAREIILTELAVRALDRLFVRVDDTEPARYRLRGDVAGLPERSAWDLRGHRLERRCHRLAWSVSDLYDSLDSEEQRQRLFPVVSRVSPFARANVHVINDLPFDARYLCELRVDLRYLGTSGVTEHHQLRFTGPPAVQRFSVVYPAITDSFVLDYRPSCVLNQPGGRGWPVVVEGEFSRAEGLVVEITPKHTGIEFVCARAESGVFDRTPGVAVSLFRADDTGSEEQAPQPLTYVTLDAVQPAAWIALPDLVPGTALRVTCVALPPADSGLAPRMLYDGPVEQGEVSIAAYWLEVLEPETVTLELDPAMAGQLVYAAVALARPDARTEDEGVLIILEPGAPKRWQFYRSSIFAPFSYRYRIHYVLRRPDGTTTAMLSTDWSSADGTTLSVSPPIEQMEQLA